MNTIFRTGAAALLSVCFTAGVARAGGVSEFGAVLAVLFIGDSCSLFVWNNPSFENAFLLLYYSYGDSAAFSAGAGWLEGMVVNTPVISESIIAGCLEIPTASVQGLSQYGADAPSYAEEDRMGFTFTTTQDSNYPELPAGTYTFMIGTALSTTDADGTLSDAASLTEPVTFNTTADTLGEAVDLIDFTLSDGGTADATRDMRRSW